MTTAIYHSAAMNKNAPQAAVPLPFPQTPESASRYIKAHGLNVTEMAAAFAVPRYTLVDLLRGQLKGTRGQAHRGAILLGLKQDPAFIDPIN